MSDEELEKLNIVEIGRPYVKCALPRTRCFASHGGDPTAKSTFEPLSKLSSALRSPELDLVVCHPQSNNPWSWRWWIRSIGNRRILRGYMPFTSMLAPQILRWKMNVPLAVVDLEDTRFIRREDLFLLDRAHFWFKRELPVDRWQAFMRTDHYSVPSGRYRSIPRNKKRVEKLHPISLGPPIWSEELLLREPIETTSDVFFAGTLEGSSFLRQRGIHELRSLEAKGVRIDIPASRISREEFFHRAAAARLVWSPEGYGWDCFRHYETPLCWSVPVINQPTIERYCPLLHGLHAFYYDPEEGGLTKTIMEALTDSKRLESMAAEANAHVKKHHLIRQLVRYLVVTTLGS